VKYRIVVLGFSLLLYGMALSLPCLLFNIVPRDPLVVNHLKDYGIYEMKGIEVTAWGILGLLFLQIPAIGWLANPAYWLSCILFARQKYKFSAITSLTAIAVGYGGTLSAFWFKLPNGSNPDSALALKKLLVGFWIWLDAPVLLALISLFLLMKMPRHLKKPT